MNSEKDATKLDNTSRTLESSHLGASGFSSVQEGEDGDGGTWTEDESEMEVEDSDVESGDDNSQLLHWDAPLQADAIELDEM